MSNNVLNDHIMTGKTGEEIACGYLRKKGYVIFEQNFRCRAGEIDIIAKRDNEISFVEVKTRRGDGFGKPSEAVNSNKQRKIINSAAYYMLLNREYKGYNVNFDIVEIILCGESAKIEHIRSAFGKEVR